MRKLMATGMSENRRDNEESSFLEVASYQNNACMLSFCTSLFSSPTFQ